MIHDLPGDELPGDRDLSTDDHSFERRLASTVDEAFPWVSLEGTAAVDALSADDKARVYEAAVDHTLIADLPLPPPPPPIAPAAFDGLRLRVKVWTDRVTGKRYLMPSAFMRDVRNGQPISDVMCAYAMSDDDTKLVTMTALEWNALPFFYFREDGSAPRATSRPVDRVPHL